MESNWLYWNRQKSTIRGWCNAIVSLKWDKAEALRQRLVKEMNSPRHGITPLQYKHIFELYANKVIKEMH